jgi:hypothetical protein
MNPYNETFSNLIVQVDNGLTKMLSTMYEVKRFEKEFFVTDESRFYKMVKEIDKMIENKFVSITRTGKKAKLKILKKGKEEILN